MTAVPSSRNQSYDHGITSITGRGVPSRIWQVDFRLCEEALSIRACCGRVALVCLRHEVFDGSVRSGCSESLSITRRTLPKSRFTVVRLINARQESPPWKLHGIERAPGHDPKFL